MSEHDEKRHFDWHAWFSWTDQRYIHQKVVLGIIIGCAVGWFGAGPH